MNIKNISLEKEVILKWEEFIIKAFCFQQEVRIMGGTLGYKVGTIWYSQKIIKEKNEWKILKLKYFQYFRVSLVSK